MKYFPQKGFTMIEILTVVAVLGLLIAVMLPKFSEVRRNQVLKTGALDIVSSLEKARSQTLSSLDSSVYGVHCQSDRVIIFKGDLFSSGAADNQEIDIVSPAVISGINLTGGAVDVYFNKLSGSPSVSGSIEISNTISTKTVTISATGAVSSN